MGLAERFVKRELDPEIWRHVPKGIQQSIYEEKRDLAVKLLQQGAALEFISKVTYLPKSELQRLMSELELECVT